ncbi:hypothetical protein HO133_000521 [Letharia lupina]|uniref:Uncharacterized protein n=1 Tax=Letharia lupina TaxID=560253 RepID=A0A8H6CHL2_9LECA|nr:uncharacterized protein HO133_000521 [Letharia lupina]KAF6223678.1 hypothetical protein HO133_000521 [Letharia lupina]
MGPVDEIGTIAGGETDNTDNNDSDNDDTDNKILTPPSPNTDVEHAGRVDNPMDHGFRATTVGQEEQTSNHLPEAPPVRDYRDANGIDHGYAMREANLASATRIILSNDTKQSNKDNLPNEGVSGWGLNGCSSLDTWSPPSSQPSFHLSLVPNGGTYCLRSDSKIQQTVGPITVTHETEQTATPPFREYRGSSCLDLLRIPKMSGYFLPPSTI